jgi:hypothetical protein
MRILFYTATTAFLFLAGVFAYYALQAPDHGTGAKVVLNIDTSQMPTGDGAVPSDADRNLFAEAEAKLKSLENRESGPASEGGGQPLETQPGESPGGLSGAGASGTAELLPDAGAGSSQDADARPLPSYQDRPVAEAEPAPDRGADASKAKDQESLSLPPGTALAELEPEAPVLRNLEQPAAQEPTQQAAADPAVEPSPAEPQASAVAPDSPPAGTSPPSGSASGKPDFNTLMAVLNEREAQNADSARSEVNSLPPPPLPLKRPGEIPDAARTAALSGWAPSRVKASEAAGQRSVRIAILLRGLGRDDKLAGDAVANLPPAISLAFVPHYAYGQQWARKARETGHEVIVQLPLEPSDFSGNPSDSEQLISSQSPEENLYRIRGLLARFDGSTGVTNFLGGKILQSKTGLKPILEELKTRGLIYVGEGNNSHAILRGIAKDIGLRYGGADLVIDVYPSPEAVRKALDDLVVLARKRGTAIGMGSATRVTIDQLQAWSQTLAAQGITLVPVGVLAQTPGAS